MIFARFRIEEARGSILAHTLRLGPGNVLRKGRTLSLSDIALLGEHHVKSVVAARLEPNDIGEDKVAAAVAAALLGPEIRADVAATGRVNLRADKAGLLNIAAAALNRLNRVNEAITVATVRPMSAVRAAEIVATVKVMPFAVPKASVDRCLAELAEARPVLKLSPFIARPAGLVMTLLPGTPERGIELAARNVATRLERCGSLLRKVVRCKHDPASVAKALTVLTEAGCWPLLIYGASAIVDRDDVVPQGIRLAGGAIEHFGMPVDPGNLMLVGLSDHTPIIGMPGCARSLKLSGFDFVLERILADLPVTSDIIMGMGVGGLLRDIPSRPRPRAATVPEVETMPPKRVAAVVLAAGKSTRMGAENKLLLALDGVPIVRRVIEQVQAAGIESIHVVTGHQAFRVDKVLKKTKVNVVYNPAYDEGMSGSLKVGLESVRQAEPGIDGVLVCLGDMPEVRAKHIQALVEAFDPDHGVSICAPSFKGKRGNPVLWSAAYLTEMSELTGDQGARSMILRYGDEVHLVEMSDEGVVTDVDTPDALAEVAARRKHQSERQSDRQSEHAGLNSPSEESD